MYLTTVQNLTMIDCSADEKYKVTSASASVCQTLVYASKLMIAGSCCFRRRVAEGLLLHRRVQLTLLCRTGCAQLIMLLDLFLVRIFIFFIARQHTDARYSNSICLSVTFRYQMKTA